MDTNTIDMSEEIIEDFESPDYCEFCGESGKGCRCEVDDDSEI